MLDDACQFEPQSNDRWEIISTVVRFPALAAKLNWLMGHVERAGFEAVALWEDDDVYLPHHLQYHAEQLKTHAWSIPRKKYVDCHRRPSIDPRDLQLHDLRCETREQPWCHGSWAFRINLWREAGGYNESLPDGFDLDFAERCEKIAGKPGDYTNVMLCHEPQYCYRWGSCGYPNGTALGAGYYQTAASVGDGEHVTGQVLPAFDAGTQRIRRLLGYSDSPPPRVPIFITNRDRLDWTRDCVKWLKRLPGAEVFVVDNASTYPPLLDWYEQQTDCTVFRLTENKGPRAAWSVKDQVIGDSQHYVVTDNDLDFSALPSDTLGILRQTLDTATELHKAGLALRIDDLPDTPTGRTAREAEAKWWEPYRRWFCAQGRECYTADVDTTFAMYRQTPAYLGQYGPAIRLAGDYTVRHRPWYKTSETLSDEDRHYFTHMNPAGLFYSPRQWAEAQQGRE